MSANALLPSEIPQSDELHVAPHLRLNRLASEPDLPENPRLVANVELAEAVELQREPVRAQIVEQGGLQAPNHRVDDVLSLFLSQQRESSLNPRGQLISSSYARSHVVQILSKGECSHDEQYCRS